MMWYGVLGTKELLHRTYRNLEQKVLLEVRAAAYLTRPRGLAPGVLPVTWCFRGCSPWPLRSGGGFCPRPLCSRGTAGGGLRGLGSGSKAGPPDDPLLCSLSRGAAQCDGRPIPLPSLQGIAVLNIPSYAGGTNFWGGTKEDDVRMGHGGVGPDRGAVA